MRAIASIAMVVLLVSVVALCPALACFTPAHACCPRHQPPVARQDCPSQMLEKGKTASLVGQAAPAPVPGVFEPRPSEPFISPAVAHVPATALFVRLGILRI
ncbi:MAG TPA: hypothetical protein VMA31_03070 [Bryobacteraceae bacterium]|nr:hypothetical protein [Bryobacteraceae bacterium]